MRTLFFEQITDDRFDSNIKELLEKRIKKIKELLDIEGVEVIVSDIRMNIRSINQMEVFFIK